MYFTKCIVVLLTYWHSLLYLFVFDTLQHVLILYPEATEYNCSYVSYSEFDDSEAQVLEFNNRYDIVVHRRVNHSEIPPETVFGCVLRIPGTDYEIREESIYKHRHGRKCQILLFHPVLLAVWRSFIHPVVDKPRIVISS